MSGVLVVYATKHGSAKEVAEAIATELQVNDTTVEVRPAKAAREPVTGRDLVVLGGAIYSGRWHRDAHRFLKRHRKDLACVPIAVFGMGPRRTGQSPGSEPGRNWTMLWPSDHGWHRPQSRSSAGLTRLAAATVIPGGIFVTGSPSAAGPRRSRTPSRNVVVIHAKQTAIRHDVRLRSTPPDREPRG